MIRAEEVTQPLAFLAVRTTSPSSSNLMSPISSDASNVSSSISPAAEAPRLATTYRPEVVLKEAPLCVQVRVESAGATTRQDRLRGDRNEMVGRNALVM